MNRRFSIKILKHLIWLLLIVSFWSCTTRRAAIKRPIKAQGAEYLLNKMSENELRFGWFTAKLNIDYIHDRKMSEFKGQIRIRKDSAIWISFSPALGIEMARLLVTDDSVKLINRIDKNYFLGDWDYVNDYLQTSIDFDMLQAFIIGNDFQFYEKTKFKAAYDSREYRLSTAERSKLKKYVKEHEEVRAFIQTIWLNPDNFKITQVSLKEIQKENKKLDAYYTKFEDLDGQLFPTRAKFFIAADEDLSVYVKYSRISINEPHTFPFNIPGKYERVY